MSVLKELQSVSNLQGGRVIKTKKGNSYSNLADIPADELEGIKIEEHDVKKVVIETLFGEGKERVSMSEIEDFYNSFSGAMDKIKEVVSASVVKKMRDKGM